MEKCFSVFGGMVSVIFISNGFSLHRKVKSIGCDFQGIFCCLYCFAKIYMTSIYAVIVMLS